VILVAEHCMEAAKLLLPQRGKTSQPRARQASIARLAAALGSICLQVLGRVCSSANQRHVTEAETHLRLDFVLSNVPLLNHAILSDDCWVAYQTQGDSNLCCASVGFALGYHILPCQGICHKMSEEPRKPTCGSRIARNRSFGDLKQSLFCWRIGDAGQLFGCLLGVVVCQVLSLLQRAAALEPVEQGRHVFVVGCF